MEARFFIGDEDDDRKRLVLLAAVLRNPTVTVETFRGEAPPHELHAFVEGPKGEPLFACVLAPPALVDHLASMTTYPVSETSTLQVVDPELSDAAVTAAMKAWIKRVFPDAVLPIIRLVQSR